MLLICWTLSIIGGTSFLLVAFRELPTHAKILICVAMVTNPGRTLTIDREARLQLLLFGQVKR